MQRGYALSDSSASELRSLGAHNVRVIPFGSYLIPFPANSVKNELRSGMGFKSSDLVVILMGRIERYKGVDLLLEAVRRLPPSSRIKVLIAGACSDKTYRDELEQLGARLGARATLRLEWIPDGDLGRLLVASDVAVFPFREITNSSSVILAESFGLPVVIPDLPLLSDVPSATAIRYTPKNDVEIDTLLEALERTERLSDSEFRDMSSAASNWARGTKWSSLSHEMVEIYESILPDAS